jgi:hypothetical protein
MVHSSAHAPSVPLYTRARTRTRARSYRMAEPKEAPLWIGLDVSMISIDAMIRCTTLIRWAGLWLSDGDTSSVAHALRLTSQRCYQDTSTLPIDSLPNVHNRVHCRSSARGTVTGARGHYAEDNEVIESGDSGISESKRFRRCSCCRG